MILIVSDKEMDKNALQDVYIKLEKDLVEKEKLTEKEKNIISNAIETIKKQKMKIYIPGKSKIVRSNIEKMIKDILTKNTNLLISRNMNTVAKKDNSNTEVTECFVYDLNENTKIINFTSHDNKISIIEKELENL